MAPRTVVELRSQLAGHKNRGMARVASRAIACLSQDGCLRPQTVLDSSLYRDLAAKACEWVDCGHHRGEIYFGGDPDCCLQSYHDGGSGYAVNEAMDLYDGFAEEVDLASASDGYS